MKLIPFGWVAFFIFLYILLIGPGDYFFLKKVLKRMELTWITFPTIVRDRQPAGLLRGLRAQGERPAGQQGRRGRCRPGGRPCARQHLDQPVQPSEPRLHDARPIPCPTGCHDRRPSPTVGPAAEPVRPPAGTEVVTSWFSVPEDQFGAMGNSSRRFSFAGSGYAYEPTAGVECLENVRIPIWSTKCVTARWFGPAARWSTPTCSRREPTVWPAP